MLGLSLACIGLYGLCCNIVMLFEFVFTCIIKYIMTINVKYQAVTCEHVNPSHIRYYVHTGEFIFIHDAVVDIVMK